MSLPPLTFSRPARPRALRSAWAGAWLAVALALAGCGQRTEEPGPSYSARPPASRDVQVYRLAIHPLHNPRKLHELYAPLADYLNRRIPGLRLEVEASNNYAHFEAKIRAREPAFLLPNPYQALLAQDMGYRVMAEVGDSEDFRGVFIVRRDSPLRQPADLKGRAVAYPAPTALAAAMLPQHWLATQGVRVLQDVDNRYVGSQESAILNAYHQTAAAAATWPPPWRAFQREHPREAAGLKLIWQTPSLINNALMARPDLPADLVERVRERLLRMHEDPEGAGILWKLETRRFNPADDARYRAVVGRFLQDYRARVGPLP